MLAPDHLNKLLGHLQCFLQPTNEREMEATLNQSQCPVFERLQRHISERIDRLNFFNVAHLYPNILLSMESLYNVCCCFCEPIKTFIF